MGILPGRRTGTKPCDVGKEERMRVWLPRGTYSHLVKEVSLSHHPEEREETLLKR
jgi:hypothetical protein